MTETIYIGSAGGAWSTLGFFAAFCALLGYGIYSLLVRPETRRAESLNLGAVSRLAGGLIAGALSGTIFLIVCRYTLSGFERIEVNGELLRLEYVYPQSSTTIRRDEIILLERRYSTPIALRFALTTQDGKSYESLPASNVAIEAARLRVAQFLVE